MSAGLMAILAAVITSGVVIGGGMLKMARAQGDFHGRVIEFMSATLRRLARLEDKADARDKRNEIRRDNGG